MVGADEGRERRRAEWVSQQESCVLTFGYPRAVPGPLAAPVHGPAGILCPDVWLSSGASPGPLAAPMHGPHGGFEPDWGGDSLPLPPLLQTP